MNVMQGQPQQAVYHANTPPNSHRQPFGYDYQQQQHQQHHLGNQHILVQQGGMPPQTMIHPHTGQPQYISIVPVQSSPHHHHQPAGPTYAYVQYAPDGSMQLHQPTVAVASSQTFIMGAHGHPIAVAANPVMYSTGSSPPGGGGMMAPLTPSRGVMSPMKSPRGTPGTDGRGKRNGLTNPRGKRGDKNAMVPSKMGPVAANLLNEIRNAKSRTQWTIYDISGHIIEFCLDQNGSRFIQQRLEVADAAEKRAVMSEVIPNMSELQNDVFGNYVVQKLFEFGNDEMKADLKGALTNNMISLSLQMYGCRVIQKALESLDYEVLCELLKEFKQSVLMCIQDQNGNHVMQKCIEVMSIKAKEAEMKSGEAGLSDSMAGRIQFIVDDVLANVETLCCHPYGCRVLQRMLEHCVEFQKTATLDEIQLVHKTLLDDQYGNYVIQHVLQYGRDSDRDSLLKIIVENDLLKLSRQKFASNVVEKLLKYGNARQRNAIVREMLQVVNESGTSQEGVGSTVLLLMVRDAYANYVVQTAIDVVPEGVEKEMLLEELKANEVQLVSSVRCMIICSWFVTSCVVLTLAFPTLSLSLSLNPQRNYTFAKHIVAKLGTK